MDKSLQRPSHRSRARQTLALIVVLFTITAAACAEGSPAPDGTAGEDGAASEDAAAAQAKFVAVDLAFEEAPESLAAGSQTFELVNNGEAPHNVTIEELGDSPVVEADPGATATGEVELEPGSYTYYCSVPGHREAGMEGSLDVT